MSFYNHSISNSNWFRNSYIPPNNLVLSMNGYTKVINEFEVATFSKYEFLEYLTEDDNYGKSTIQYQIFKRKELIQKFKLLPYDIELLIWKFLWSFPKHHLHADIKLFSLWPLASIRSPNNYVPSWVAQTFNVWHKRKWQCKFHLRVPSYGYYVVYDEKTKEPGAIYLWKNEDPGRNEIFILKKNLYQFML